MTMRVSRMGTAILSLCALSSIASGQQGDSTSDLAQLELTAEVATTTDEGYPAALRVTVKNVGGTTVDMPALVPGCLPDRVLEVEVFWDSDDLENPTATGSGGACGTGDQLSLLNRIKRRWVRLRPGEFMTQTVSMRERYDPSKRGTVSYRAAYLPPLATKQEIEEAKSAGYVIPIKRISTEQQSFRVQ